MRFRLGLLLAVLLLPACRRAPSSSATSSPPSASAANQAATSGSPAYGDWIVQQIGADPESLNPLIDTDEIGSEILGEVFEGMLTVNNYTLKLDPALATSYEISPDQLTYTFHLRHGVTWQDGAPFTAADVKYTFDRIVDPKVDDAPIRSYFDTFKSCTVLDPYTVRFVTSERYFKTLEMIGTEAILPKHLLDNAGDFNSEPFNRAPVGTGPYRFVRWDTGSQVVLERNDHYWGLPTHYLSRLVYRIIQEPYVAAALLKKGEIDVMDPVQPLQWQRELANSRSMSRLTRVVYDFPAYNYLGFNLHRDLFKDVRLREAIDLLIPRDQILKQVYLNQYATPTEGYDPPGSPNYNHAIPITPYDPARAAALLAQAGWKLNASDGLLHRGSETLSFTVVYGAGSTSAETMLEIMQESMQRAGIELKLQRLEAVQMYAKLYDWDYDAVIGGWALDIDGDPTQLWSGAQADLKKSSNFIGFKNAEADRLMAAGRLEYDDAKRAAIYQQLQKLIHDDYPVCFLFNPREIMLRSNRFQNVKIFTPRPCFDISTWWVPKDLQKYHDRASTP
jgi:peptide/nickel transport system substrate-binding protein